MDILSPEQSISLDFPDAKNFQVTSRRTGDYNCIAWAAGENDRWWWPDRNLQYFWPKSIPREVTVAAFVAAFEIKGYSVCDSPELEPEYDKIVIYTSATGRPTHAARQLPNGKWTSKLGAAWDISHEVDDIAGFKGKSYGRVCTYMKRLRIP